MCPDCPSSGIPTCECDIYWDRRPSPGERPRRSLNTGHHDASVSQAAKDVNASQDMLIDLFERIGRFFRRLESYTERVPSEGMTDIMVEIMVEVLSVLAAVTVEIKQKRRSQFTNRNLLHPDSYFSRKIPQEATREERRRGGFEEAGQTDWGRGEDGDGRSVKKYTQCR